MLLKIAYRYEFYFSTVMHDTPMFKSMILNDGNSVILRKNPTGPDTIEIQKTNSNKVMEIRYERD